MAYYAPAHAGCGGIDIRNDVAMMVNLGTRDSPSYFAVQALPSPVLGDRRVIKPRADWLPLLTEGSAVSPDQDGAKLSQEYGWTAVRRWQCIQALTAMSARAQGSAWGTASGSIRNDFTAIRALPAPSPRLTAEREEAPGCCPLYPQYCSSTTCSVFDGERQVLQRRRWLPADRFVKITTGSRYIGELAGQHRESWKRAGERSQSIALVPGDTRGLVKEGDHISPKRRRRAGW